MGGDTKFSVETEQEEAQRVRQASLNHEYGVCYLDQLAELIDIGTSLRIVLRSDERQFNDMSPRLFWTHGFVDGEVVPTEALSSLVIDFPDSVWAIIQANYIRRYRNRVLAESSPTVTFSEPFRSASDRDSVRAHEMQVAASTGLRRLEIRHSWPTFCQAVQTTARDHRHSSYGVTLKLYLGSGVYVDTRARVRDHYLEVFIGPELVRRIQREWAEEDDRWHFR